MTAMMMQPENAQQPPEEWERLVVERVTAQDDVDTDSREESRMGSDVVPLSLRV